jgi:spore coat polysaccharide biosynthesis predicted glycosyltransferase SpsG
MEKQHIVFRADASNAIGLGHIMRCLAFVEGLPISTIPHLVIRESDYIKQAIEIFVSKGWDIHTLSSKMDWDNDAIDTVKFASSVHAPVIVTDLCTQDMLKNPFMLANYHVELKKNSDAFVLSIEDTRTSIFSSDVAFIYNSVGKKDAKREVLNGGVVLEDIKYFICHPRIAEAGSRNKIIKKKASRVIVCISGSDPFGITPKVAKALTMFSDDTVSAKIVVGSAMKEKDSELVKKFVKDKKNIEVVGFTDEFYKLLLWADVAVLGDGLTKFEAATIGTPTLMITQFSDDTEPVVQDFLSLGSARYIGEGTKLSSEEIFLEIQKFLNEYDARILMSQAGKQSLDGYGAKRIYNEVLKKFFE